MFCLLQLKVFFPETTVAKPKSSRNSSVGALLYTAHGRARFMVQDLKLPGCLQRPLWCASISRRRTGSSLRSYESCCREPPSAAARRSRQLRQDCSCRSWHVETSQARHRNLFLLLGPLHVGPQRDAGSLVNGCKTMQAMQAGTPIRATTCQGGMTSTISYHQCSCPPLQLTSQRS
jgi:hypothetical protein